MHILTPKQYTVRNFYRNFPKHVIRVLFSYFLINVKNNFLIFTYKVNILILVAGNSETYNRNNFMFRVTKILCIYMWLKIWLQFPNFMINYIKNLLQFGSFKIHSNKIQLSFMILRKISENSVHFSQFQDIFTQKHRTFVKYKFCKFPNISNSALDIKMQFQGFEFLE